MWLFLTEITIFNRKIFFEARGDERHSSNTLKPFSSTLDPLSYLPYIDSLHYVLLRLV